MTRTTTVVLATAFLLLPLAAANAVEHRAEERRVGETSPSQTPSTATDCTAKPGTPQANATGRDRRGAAGDQAQANNCAGATTGGPTVGDKATGRDRKSQ